MAKARVSSIRLPPVDRPNNRLLAALPVEDFHRILPDLKTLPIRVKQVLQKQGEPFRHVYFPNGGVCSVTAVLADGTAIEAATIGDEGMIGFEAFLEEHAIAPGQALIQVPDTSVEMMSVEAFRRELARRGALYDLMGAYTRSVIGQMVQTTACNAIHNVQQRCSRWLLMTHDRMHEQDFRLSHEFLGVMLGVRRQTVTVVAGELQSAGLIRYIHGRVRVLNRKGLEQSACECYAVIRGHFDRLYKK